MQPSMSQCWELEFVQQLIVVGIPLLVSLESSPHTHSIPCTAGLHLVACRLLWGQVCNAECRHAAKED